MGRAPDRLAGRRDVVVVGLTASDEREVERFIGRHKVRFTVGARSRSARDFGCDRLPSLRMIDRNGPARELDESGLQAMFAGRAPGGEDADGPANGEGEHGAAGTAAQTRELLAFVESGADGHERAAALWKLRQALGSEPFAEFAADRLQFEPDPWARGVLRYLLNNPGAAHSPLELSESAAARRTMPGIRTIPLGAASVSCGSMSRRRPRRCATCIPDMPARRRRTRWSAAWW